MSNDDPAFFLSPIGYLLPDVREQLRDKCPYRRLDPIILVAFERGKPSFRIHQSFGLVSGYLIYPKEWKRREVDAFLHVLLEEAVVQLV